MCGDLDTSYQVPPKQGTEDPRVVFNKCGAHTYNHRHTCTSCPHTHLHPYPHPSPGFESLGVYCRMVSLVMR